MFLKSSIRILTPCQGWNLLICVLTPWKCIIQTFFKINHYEKYSWVTDPADPVLSLHCVHIKAILSSQPQDLTGNFGSRILHRIGWNFLRTCWQPETLLTQSSLLPSLFPKVSEWHHDLNIFQPLSAPSPVSFTDVYPSRSLKCFITSWWMLFGKPELIQHGWKLKAQKWWRSPSREEKKA